MSGLNDRVADAAARAIHRAMWLALLLPDRHLAAIANATTKTLRPIVHDPDALFYIEELEKVFRAGPPMSDVPRRIVRGGRTDQLRAVISGYLRHWLPVEIRKVIR